jgi:hypothetical protein
LVVTSGTKLASDETDSFYKKVLTVNPWSLDELQEANTAGMKFPNVEECFLNVGGSIRHIREGLAACTRWSSGVIHRIGSAESNATIAALIAVDGSDRIARQFVQKDAICTESFVRVVDSRVLYKALLEKRSDLLVGGSVDKLLKVGKNIGGAFYGHVFELWVHTQVKKYLSFKLKLRLDDADGNQVYQVEEFEFSQFRTVNPSDPKSKRTSIHDELKKSINTDGVFSVPGMSNYPTSDSFATPFLEKKQQSLLLQITIATTHSFGIADAMETLTCIGKLTYSKPMFVFLVPDADLDNFIIHEDAKTQNVTENFRVSVASITFDKVKKRRHAFISHSDTE